MAEPYLDQMMKEAYDKMLSYGQTPRAWYVGVRVWEELRKSDMLLCRNGIIKYFGLPVYVDDRIESERFYLR